MSRARVAPTLSGPERRALQTVGMWEDCDGRWRSDKGPLAPNDAKAHAVELAESVLRALARLSRVSRKGERNG